MLTWRLASACSIEAAGTAARASDGAAKAMRATRNVRKSMVGGKKDVRVRNERVQGNVPHKRPEVNKVRNWTHARLD